MFYWFDFLFPASVHYSLPHSRLTIFYRDALCALSLRNLVSGYECGRVFQAGVEPGSPSRDAANWLPSRFSLSVETRLRYGWLRMMFPAVRPFRAPTWYPSGKVTARERQGALSRRAWKRSIGWVHTRFGEGGGNLDCRRARGALNSCGRESKARTGRFAPETAVLRRGPPKTLLEHPPKRPTFYMLLSRRKLSKCVESPSVAFVVGFPGLHKTAKKSTAEPRYMTFETQNFLRKDTWLWTFTFGRYGDVYSSGRPCWIVGTKIVFSGKATVFMPFFYRSNDQPVFLVLLQRCRHVSGPFMVNQGRNCRHVYTLNTHLKNRNRNKSYRWGVLFL